MNSYRSTEGNKTGVDLRQTRTLPLPLLRAAAVEEKGRSSSCIRAPACFPRPTDAPAADAGRSSCRTIPAAAPLRAASRRRDICAVGMDGWMDEWVGWMHHTDTCWMLMMCDGGQSTLY